MTQGGIADRQGDSGQGDAVAQRVGLQLDQATAPENRLGRSRLLSKISHQAAGLDIPGIGPQRAPQAEHRVGAVALGDELARLPDQMLLFPYLVAAVAAEPDREHHGQAEEDDEEFFHNNKEGLRDLGKMLKC